MAVYTIPRRQKKPNLLSRISVTVLLISLNVVLFILFSVLLYFEVVPLDFIAIQPANILSGNYLWTIITSMFMHSPNNLFHLFVNMFSLLFVGSLVSRILGPRRYIYFYLAAGIFASLFFVLAALIFSSELTSYAVGASGAIFGLVGLLMLLVPNLPVYIMFIPIPVKMKYAAPGILIVLWIISVAGNVPIGNTAHLGGFVLGIVYGLYLRRKYKRKTQMLGRLFS